MRWGKGLGQLNDTVLSHAFTIPNHFVPRPDRFSFQRMNKKWGNLMFQTVWCHVWRWSFHRIIMNYHSWYFHFAFWAWMAGSETKNRAGNVWTTSRLCRLTSWQNGPTGKNARKNVQACLPNAVTFRASGIWKSLPIMSEFLEDRFCVNKKPHPRICIYIYTLWYYIYIYRYNIYIYKYVFCFVCVL